MHQTIILTSLVIVLSIYALVARVERNWVNILTPFLLFSVPGWYVLELVYGFVFGYQTSVFSYFYCYLTYTLGVVATVLGYFVMPSRPSNIFVRLPRIRIPYIPYLFLGFAVLLYAQILIQFPNLLVSPRQIYELTRSGFGLQFFLSAFAVYVGFILLLFSRSSGRISLGIFSLIGIVVLYLHGSKSQILNLLLIGLYFLVFVTGKRFDFKRTVVLGVVASFFISALFYVTSYGRAGADLLIGMAGYAEYTRNAALIIDDAKLTPQWGKLTAESRLYVLVPRVLFPDKPKDYGGLWLARRYFPERFDSDSGSPDFGIGFLYADFGVFAIVYYCIGALMAGAILKLLVSRLRFRPDAGTFLLFLVFMEVGLIPTGGGGVPLVVYYLLAHVVRSLADSAYQAPGAPVQRDSAHVAV